MTDREGTNEPGGADEIAAARDALHEGRDPLADASELSSIVKKQSDAAKPATDNPT